MNVALSNAYIGSLSVSLNGGELRLGHLRTRTAVLNTTDDNVVVEVRGYVGASLH